MNGDTPVNIFGVLAYPNDEGGRLIRFIDSDYNTLFHVPDGGSIILTTFGDDRKILCGICSGQRSGWRRRKPAKRFTARRF